MESLSNIDQGDLVFLTGGPSTGKSLIVKRLFSNRPDCLYLNGRKTGSNIMNAIIGNIKKRDSLSKKTIALTDIGKHKRIIKVFELLTMMYNAYLKEPEKSPELLENVLEILSTLRTPIKGIVFDEANIYFNADSLPFLNCLTALTKEDQELFVIMASSDYGLPITLSKIGYNINHISKTLVMSDVAPRDM
jgi:hypothetical protein